MKLLLDLGNTRLKWALFDDNGMGPMHAEVVDQIDALPFAESALLATSCADPRPLTQLAALLAAAGITELTRVGPPYNDDRLTLAYTEPRTLGVDRWLAMRAACAVINESSVRACIVASAGSALTVDAVDDVAMHLGGCIAPGVAAMRRALSSSAPHLESALGDLQEFADSTINAVHSGPLLAAAALIQRQRSVLALRVGYLPRCVITGGDAESLRALLPSDVQYVADLVLRGMQTLGSTTRG